MMFPSDDANHNFTELLDRLVLEQAATASSFDELVSTLPGVYPTDVLVTLGRLEGDGRLATSHVTTLRSRSTAAPQHPSSDFLPPHPLDFDWRFSAPTIRELTSSLVAKSHGEEVVLLGTPSLLHPIESTGTPVRLIDSGRHVRNVATNNPRIIGLDITHDALPSISARLVIMDPPWYGAHFRAFLWAAAKLAAPQGQVWTTFPSRGTRPRVAQELRDLVSYAGSVGLRQDAVQEGAIRYDSPPFELSALRAGGLSGLPLDWRTADLVSFILEAPNQAPRPKAFVAPAWDEITVGSVRVRLRPSRQAGEPQLQALVQGDVLPSVSTRDPLRDQADVWTTCNRIYKCSNTVELGEILRALTTGEADRETPGRPVSVEPGASLLQRIDELLQIEQSDLSLFGWLN